MALRLSKIFVIVMIGIAAVGVSAASAINARNTTWQKAQTVTLQESPAILFGVLGSNGDGRFFSLKTTKATNVKATIDVPVWADDRFRPQLVVYQPDVVTASPALPLVQPPSTIALVYPLTTQTRHTDAATQIRMIERMNTTIELPVAGQYYFAVYNADRGTGRWRLSLTDQAGEQHPTVWSWPKRWWISQHWASPSPATHFLPVILLGTMVFVLAWNRMKTPRPTHRKKTK